MHNTSSLLLSFATFTMVSGCVFIPDNVVVEGIEITAEDDIAVMELFEREWIAETQDGTVHMGLLENWVGEDQADTCSSVEHVVMGAERAEDAIIGRHYRSYGGCFGEAVEGYLSGRLSGGRYAEETIVHLTFILAETEADYETLYELPYEVELEVDGDDEQSLIYQGVLLSEDQLEVTFEEETVTFTPAT